MVKKVTSQKLLDLSSLRKKYPQAATGDILLPGDDALVLPSRILAHNHQLGGGLPYGKIQEILGYESTGKSLLAMDYGYTAQYAGGVVLWNDAEGSFSRAWAESNGLDVSRIELLEDNSVEVLSDWSKDMVLYYRSKLVRNEPILLVIDSIATLECEMNIDSDQTQDKAEMGNRAKAIYRMYRKRLRMWKKYGVSVIAINQVREKVNASLFENAETTPGGAATKFYASQRVATVRSKQIKIGEHKVGQNIILQIRKNKTAPPRDSLYSQVFFTPEKTGYTGYHRIYGLPELFLEKGYVKRKGSNIYYKDSLIARSEEKFLDVLMSDDKLRRRLINKAEINTVGKLTDKLATIKTNQFPVKLKAAKEEEGDS